ncbi:MAG: LysR family transcriptional regulator [Glaciimonas sp.]|nr:LysR family transcriptional regulator [Glaciimonas sp.]
MSRIIDMSSFVAVVECASISEAARRLGTTKSAVSRRMTELEQRLGAVLLIRTTRNVRITEAGKEFFNSSVRILAQITEAEEALDKTHTMMRGRLRIAAPMAFGISYLGHFLSDFATSFPELHVDIEVDDRYASFQDEGFDLAIRLGVLPDSSLIAKQIGPNRHFICASPSYLEKHGSPNTPHDLKDHHGLHYINREPNGMWQLQVDGDLKSFRVGSRVRTNSGHYLLEAARAGLGLAILPTFLCADALIKGDLCAVMPAYPPAPANITAVYNRDRRASPKIHTLIDFIRTKIRQPPSWDVKIDQALAARSALSLVCPCLAPALPKHEQVVNV